MCKQDRETRKISRRTDGPFGKQKGRIRRLELHILAWVWLAAHLLGLCLLGVPLGHNDADAGVLGMSEND